MYADHHIHLLRTPCACVHTFLSSAVVGTRLCLAPGPKTGQITSAQLHQSLCLTDPVFAARRSHRQFTVRRLQHLCAMRSHRAGAYSSQAGACLRLRCKQDVARNTCLGRGQRYCVRPRATSVHCRPSAVSERVLASGASQQPFEGALAVSVGGRHNQGVCLQGALMWSIHVGEDGSKVMVTLLATYHRFCHARVLDGRICWAKRV